MARALVLGGGGPVGIAWEIGVVAGLTEAGIDLAKADRIIGTSAGSVVGALLGSGEAPRDLYAAHRALAHREAAEGKTKPPPDLSRLMQFILRRPSDRPAGAELLAEMGAFALAAQVLDEASYLAATARMLGSSGRGWPERFVCTAVDAATGAFRAWDKASKVALDRAVASSCAVPGIYPPVTIGDSRYFDGGMRSSTNADLAAGFAEVVMLAVTVLPVADRMAGAARREVARLGPAIRSCVIVPDPAALAVFGGNLMDRSRRAEVAEAGFVQGQAEATRLRDALAG
jgi:NTE family protein